MTTLLLILVKQLVPSYLYLEIDKISQAIIPLKYKGPKCWKIHFLVFRFEIFSFEGGGDVIPMPPVTPPPPYKERAYTRPMRPPNPKPSTFKIQMNEGVVSKETVVLRRWGSSIQKFGFINGVDNVNWPPYRDSKS